MDINPKNRTVKTRICPTTLSCGEKIFERKNNQL